MAAIPKTIWEEREYLAVAAVSQTRLELINGEIYDMAGASRIHIKLCVNFSGLLYAQLRTSGCELLNGDMRVKVNPDNYFYPDLSVVCGEQLYTADQPPSLLNPIFIVEVLSESTFQKDWDVKLPLYQAIPSVQEIVLIAQDQIRVHHIQRQLAPPTQAQWTSSIYSDSAAVLTFASIGCHVRLAELYERIVF
jgi:Uma2 family endonuclease